ncbi:MAG: NifU family protein [Bacteroidales bacterium]|nr:NifU family protein [Bacteroidales bacterium]
MVEPNLRDRVESALREFAAPALELDGSGIEVVAVADGIASVRLSGVCAGCPATISTILFGLEHELRKHIDGVEFLEVVP